MKWLGLSAYIAGIAATTVYVAPVAIVAVRYSMKSGSNAAMIWSLWAVATLSPLILSLIGWLLSRHIRKTWLPHLVFLPIAFLAFQQTMPRFLLMSGMEMHDGPAGDAIAPGMLYLSLASFVHVCALVKAIAGGRKQHA